MRASIATVCISGSLQEKLAAIARAGFDGFELFENDFIASPLSAEDVAKRSADLGLSLDLYQPFRDIEGTDDATFNAALERARHKFQLMNRLGAELLLVCSNVATATIDDDDHAAEQLSGLADVAADHGIRVAYEALAWGRNVSTYDHAWSIVATTDHPALGICLDSFHILSRGSDLEKIATISAEKLFFCQLADAPTLDLDVLSWSRHHRVFPGEGDWDLADFASRVISAGYSGPLSLEVFNDSFRQSEPSVTARDARRSLLVLEDAIRIDSGRPGIAADVPLVTLPELAGVRGIDFVELQPGEGGHTEDLLSNLGFTRAGRHRRKNVELWSQGDVRVIVNYELFGREARLAAVGLLVDNIDDASARADTLGAPRSGRDERPGEVSFDAVVAPDGTEFFLRAAENAGWAQDFDISSFALQPVPLTPDGGAKITHVDHIALAQPGRRIDEAALFFRSVLGFNVGVGLDLASETGLVHSRALVSSHGEVRLALNVMPDGASSGAALPNHIALAVTDLIDTAAELRRRGVELLPVPENYYDDLIARFALTEDFIEQLRHGNLLYDRDLWGEFLHTYTPPIGSISLELVERRNDYRGFGAPNAPIRMAAMRSAPLLSIHHPSAR